MCCTRKFSGCALIPVSGSECSTAISLLKIKEGSTGASGTGCADHTQYSSTTIAMSSRSLLHIF